MKKIFFLFFISGFMLLNTSCRKDYSCTCTSVFTGGSYKQVTVAKSTKQDAKAWCASMQISNAQPGVSTTCALD
ncbi:MAG TPA: hypothetical protein VKG26_00320 [Bacteroidia bacterium]|nr:hypothetical protein [Bacteroidia bacterium]